MSTMAEDNAKDMKNLREIRAAASVLASVLRNKEIRLSTTDGDLVLGARSALEKRAEHIEAVWN